MTKRIGGALLALALCLALLPAPARAADTASGSCGQGVNWRLDNAGTLTISGVGAMEDLDNGCSDADYYPSRSLIQKVVVQTGVTRVGSYAFGEDFSNLETVILGADVASVGESAFSGCEKLADLTLSDSLETIDWFAFMNCKSLKSVTLPAGLSEIGYEAFRGCGLTGVTIPAGVTEIGENAFGGCPSLAAIRVAAGSASYLGDGGVLYNRGKTQLLQYPAGRAGAFAIPAGVRYIRRQAFYNCKSLTGVTIPAGVTGIDYETFYGCGSLAGVTIPAGVTEIGDLAFYGCASLANAALPNSLTTLGEQAFKGCAALTDAALPDGLTALGGEAFRGCAALTDVTIPAGVTEIGYKTFCGCGLTSVTIPAGVTSIGTSAFEDCDSLADVWYGGEPAQWEKIDIGDFNGPLTEAAFHTFDPGASSVAPLSRSGGAVTATVNCARGVTGATAVCVSYGAAGRLLDARCFALEAGSSSLSFTPAAGAARVKVFVLRASGIPLCRCAELAL